MLALRLSRASRIALAASTPGPYLCTRRAFSLFTREDHTAKNQFLTHSSSHCHEHFLPGNLSGSRPLSTLARNSLWCQNISMSGVCWCSHGCSHGYGLGVNRVSTPARWYSQDSRDKPPGGKLILVVLLHVYTMSRCACTCTCTCLGYRYYIVYMPISMCMYVRMCTR